MKSFKQCSCLFLIVLVASVIFLLLGLLLPQTRIHENTRVSADLMLQEGTYPEVAAGGRTSTLDNFTEAYILAESHAMSSQDWKTIFTNPRYKCTLENASPINDLQEYVNGNISEPTSYYVRYWMGFRPIVRMLLILMNYYQIRRYLAATVFFLITAAVCSVCNHLNKRSALAFALSILAIRPYVVAQCLQFSCCFIIAMTAMLLMPKLCKHEKYDLPVFMSIGMITMFFDFYSTPVITFGLPFLYLYILRKKEHRTIQVWNALQCITAWFCGYLGMWLSKLLLTSLFTDVNGLENGFNSASKWLRNRQSFNGPLDSIQAVFETLCVDNLGIKLLVILFVATLIVWIFILLHRKYSVSGLLHHTIPLLIAAVPLIWFAIASKPTVHHVWFQYRSIVVTIWAVMIFFFMTAEEAASKT